MAFQVRRYFIAGKVQGVGFRNYTQKKARQLGVNGWVRNLEDGRVEALAVAEAAKLLELERFLHRGPMHAEVTGVEKLDSEANNAPSQDDFEILF